LRPGHEEVLAWTRSQQAAYLITLWNEIQRAIEESRESWASHLRKSAPDEDLDPAFFGPHTLLATDQGVRGVLQVSNDVSFVLVHELHFPEWREPRLGDAEVLEEIEQALRSISKHRRLVDFLRRLARSLTRFDWRTSGAPGLPEEVRLRQAAYRGSGGYRELRIGLTRVLSKSEDTLISNAALDVGARLGFS
jgi:hypothetical protein